VGEGFIELFDFKENLFFFVAESSCRRWGASFTSELALTVLTSGLSLALANDFSSFSVCCHNLTPQLSEERFYNNHNRFGKSIFCIKF
jgi:hypothetical protein